MFCCNLLKLRITVLPVMQKARVVKQKTQRTCNFVDSHESSVGESVCWAWLQPFARKLYWMCYKFLAKICWFPPEFERSSCPLFHHHHLDHPLG